MTAHSILRDFMVTLLEVMNVMMKKKSFDNYGHEAKNLDIVV